MLVESSKKGIMVGLKTTWTLGKIIFPVTLIVALLQHTPILPWVIKLITPLMNLIGLSGDTAIPLVLGNFLNLYAAIGAILTLDLTVKEVFIVAVMLSFSHNMLIESSVAVKVGVKLCSFSLNNECSFADSAYNPISHRELPSVRFSIWGVF